MRILLTPTVRKNALEFAQALVPEGDTLILGDPREGDVFLEKVRNCDAIMGNFVKFPPEAWAAARGRVKLMQQLSAGYDRVNIELAREFQIPVAQNGGANAVAVAEHTVMLMLAAYRRLVELAVRTRFGGWRDPLDEERYYELAGKVVGIIGMGNIGFEVMKRLRAFDTKIIYADEIRRPLALEKEYDLEYVTVDELCSKADIVTLHATLIDSSRHLINARRLSVMKPSALLVNTSRGGLIDEAALLERLDANALFGAALDTLVPEPPPSDHRLMRHPKVIVTPHTAGPTWESWPKRFANAYANIDRVGRGEAPQWLVPELRGVA
jgi:phosphoglycerate dehydrogenase-like enzyme